MIYKDRYQDKRLIGLDYLKVLAILMVIALHVSLYRVNFIQSGKIFNVIQYSLRLLTEGVPLFLITNGYLLFRKNNINYEGIYKKAFYYFFLYLIFGSLTIFVMKYDYSLSLGEYITELFKIGNGEFYTEFLWFIQNLIATYLIFPIFHYLYTNNYSMFQKIFSVILFFLLGKHTANVIAEIFLRIDADYFSAFKHISNIFETFDPFSISSFLLFFLLGAYVNKNLDVLTSKIKQLWIISVTGWIASILYTYILSNITIHLLQPSFLYGSVVMVIQTITIFVTFLKIPERGTFLEKIIKYISSSTLWIYFVHNIVIYIFIRYHNFGSLPERILFLIIVFIISILISIIIRFIEKTAAKLLK